MTGEFREPPPPLLHHAQRGATPRPALRPSSPACAPFSRGCLLHCVKVTMQSTLRLLPLLVTIAIFVAGCATPLTSAHLNTFRDDYRQRLASDSAVGPLVAGLSDPRDRRSGPGTVEIVVSMNGPMLSLVEPSGRETVYQQVAGSLIAAYRQLPPGRIFPICCCGSTRGCLGDPSGPDRPGSHSDGAPVNLILSRGPCSARSGSGHVGGLTASVLSASTTAW
jgi:hypothetical protein